MPNNATYRFTGKPADRILMFCPVGFKSAGNIAMTNAIGLPGNGTFDSATEYTNNGPSVPTHVFINIAVSDIEKTAMLATDFGAVDTYLTSDSWSEKSAANDLGLGLMI